MISLPFDQYQRYNTAQKVINSVRKGNEVFTILEVGANEHQNLEKFLPEDEITYLDIQLPEHLLNRPEYILGDATKMSFSESKYDIIVALDVFEHIAEEDRIKFINELHRVSKKLFIIGAPFQAKEVSQAEEEANDCYKLLQGEDYRWLKEHMDNTLPDLEYYLDYMKAHGIRYQYFSHGSIDMWSRLMQIHFLATLSPLLVKDRVAIDQFYNQNLYRTDIEGQCYRSFIVGLKGKTEQVSDVFLKKDKGNHDMYSEFLKLEMEFYSRFIKILLREKNDSSNLANTHISNLENIITSKNVHISNLEEMIISKNTHISNIEGVVISRDTHISNLEEAVNSKDVHISNLEETAISKDAHISNLEEATNSKDVHISNLEDMIQHNKKQINDMENEVTKYKEELDLINNTLFGRLLERSRNLRRRR